MRALPAGVFLCSFTKECSLPLTAERKANTINRLMRRAPGCGDRILDPVTQLHDAVQHGIFSDAGGAGDREQFSLHGCEFVSSDDFSSMRAQIVSGVTDERITWSVSTPSVYPAFRRCKLHIPRPAASGRSRPFRCISSFDRTRCAGLRSNFLFSRTSAQRPVLSFRCNERPLTSYDSQ